MSFVAELKDAAERYVLQQTGQKQRQLRRSEADENYVLPVVDNRTGESGDKRTYIIPG